MGMHRLDIFTSDGRLRTLECWAMYAAFAPIPEGKTLVKVGMTQSPLRRIYEVHCGSPYPIKRAIWQHVGSKASARSAELVALNGLSSKHTRGEWFCLDMKSPEDKELLHSSLRRAVARATKKLPKWNHTNIETIKDSLGLDYKRWKV